MTSEPTSRTFLPRRLHAVLRGGLALAGLRRSGRGERALALARQQLAAIRAAPDSPFTRAPRPGHRRGIDFYDEAGLLAAVGRALAQYESRHGVFPDLVAPAGLNEKIQWLKFFGEIKVPESGNKLLTPALIPGDLRGALRCPEILWHSPEPRLPADADLPPGHYYLKASHGSRMVRRIRYPLSPGQRAELEGQCALWLRTPYGLAHGEWWYSAFRPEVLIEQDVAGEERSLACCVMVLDGEPGYLVLKRKAEGAEGGEDEVIRLDADFRDTGARTGGRPMTSREVPAALRARIIEGARRIGAQFAFARVDFLLGAGESLFLGEVTFSPGNGMTRRPRELELSMGALLASVPGQGAWPAPGGTVSS